MGLLASVFMCAFVGGILGGIGATWWAISFSHDAKDYDMRNPRWKGRSGLAFSVAFGIAIIGAFVHSAIVSRDPTVPSDSFAFFATYSLPTFIVSFLCSLAIYSFTKR